MQSSNQVSRSSSSRQGAVALVEFAIVLVPLLLLSFGAMSVSELVRVQQSIDRVAAEAARAAIAARPLVNTNQSSVRAAATVLATTRMRRLLNEAGLSLRTRVSHWLAIFRGAAQEPKQPLSRSASRIAISSRPPAAHSCVPSIPAASLSSQESHMNECLALRRRRRNKQSGRRAPAQVLVLFALCLPVLVGTAALLVDLTILLRDYAQLHQVAAAAARAGAQETSSLWLYATNTFTLVGAEGPARAAAERVCSAYRRGGLPGVQCAARVSAMEVSPFRREPGLAAAWTLFLSRDRPTSGPGQTIHGGVTVTASRIFRPLFVDVLVGNAGIPLRAEATAVLVTGP